MRVYVAGKFEDKAQVRAVHMMLRLLGHEIAHDWTGEDAAGKHGEVLEAYLQGCAAGALSGVERADLLVLLNHPRGRGSLVELGVALARRIPAVVIRPNASPCIFFHIGAGAVRTFPTLADALAAIASGVRVNADA